MKQITNKKYRVPSPVEELQIVEFTSLSGDKAKFIDNDLALLFNQERLEKVGNDTMINYLNGLVPTSDALAELKKNCTDEELLSLVKSRHIQSRNELELWSKWLNYNKGELDNAIADAKKASMEAQFVESKEEAK